MAWKADRIYMLPNADLVDYLQNTEGFADELFLVNDLEGIRSDWTRNFMLSDLPNENAFRKHSLPEGGLLAVKPKLYKSNYHDSDSEDDKFWETYADYPVDKWDFLDEYPFPKILSDLELKESQSNLLGFLQVMNEKFKTPILYYYCSMWGGDIDEEIAVVFDGEVEAFQYDEDKRKGFALTAEGQNEVESSILQSSLAYLGLDLPTFFFALHEGSFDFRRYHI